MIKRLLLLVVTLTSLLLVAGGSLAPALASAAPKDEICQGIGVASGTGGCAPDGSLTHVVQNVINIFSVVVGVVAVIMIMVGGFKFITAGGDSGNVASARQTIVYAIVGLVIVALSQAIVKFVLQKTK